MGFILGLLGGLVAGAAGAVFYSQQTGRDLREEFQQIRSEIKARDFEALSTHLEDRFKELQSSIEKLMAEAGQQAAKTTGDMAETVESAERGHRVRHEPVDVLRALHVRHHVQRLDAARADLGLRGAQCLLAARAHRDAHALVRERQRNRAPNPARTARHDCGLTG